MDEIAPIAIHATPFMSENSTLLGLVLGVDLAVFSQLMRPVCEFTFLPIWAVPVFYKLFAQLTLLLVLIE